MNSLSPVDQRGYFKEDPGMVEMVQKAMRLMDEAFETPSTELKKEVEALESGVVQLRDRLIERMRAETGDKVLYLRALLDRVNIALSLVVSIEYPGAGIHREALEEARHIFRQLIDDNG